MEKHELDIAANIVHQLMQYDFSSHTFEEQLAQVDQGYMLTIQTLEALAEQSNDPRIKSLAQLAIQAWNHA